MKDNATELFTEVSQHDEVIGSIERSVANSTPTRFHRSIKVLVFNSQGELLIQKRSASKDTFPNCWDISVAGHVDFEESYLEAAIRETQEEVGLLVTKQSLRLLGKLLIELPWETEFQQCYRIDLKTSHVITFPEDEVAEVMWINSDQLKTMTNDTSYSWTSPAITNLKAFGLI